MRHRNLAAIVGVAEYAARKTAAAPILSDLEMAAELAGFALADASLSLADVDGLVVSRVRESMMFAPATVAEYLGVNIKFAEYVDLGGATAVGMVWRAAAAIEQGIARTILCILPGTIPEDLPEGAELARFGGSSYRPGSPQAEFDIPYGHVGQNPLYAFFAQRYAHCYGYDERAMARLVVHQRRNGSITPGAIFHGRPVSEEDVLESPMIARPLRKLEIVMPVWGGAAVVLTARDVARSCRHRPVWVLGSGEALGPKSPQYASDMLDIPLFVAAANAFARAGKKPGQVQTVQIYDCYTIMTLMALEASGFCRLGTGMNMLKEREFGFDGDFPLNTNGGQLGFGQAGMAGGMTHVIEAVLQLAGRAEKRQTPNCNVGIVTGNGGVMSEQSAIVLQGD